MLTVTTKAGHELISMSNQSNGGVPYLQFPLCSLAYAESIILRLNTILDYSVVEAGMILWQKASEQVKARYLEAWTRSKSLPRGFSICSELHQATLFGAEIIGVKFGCIASALNGHRDMAGLVSYFQSRHGPDPLVRIRKDLFFEARDGGGVTYQEFSVLAGIFSIIGKKAYAKIAQNTIGLRALGYKTEEVLDRELRHRLDHAKPLSEWHLRTTIYGLHERKLFARVVFGRRHSFYSHRMDQRALEQRIVERKTHQAGFRLERKLSDDELTKIIRNKRAMLAGKPLPHPSQSIDKPTSRDANPHPSAATGKPPGVRLPTLPEVLEWGKIDGIPPEVCEQFFVHNAGLGWMHRQTPIRFPRAWLKKYWANRGRTRPLPRKEGVGSSVSQIKTRLDNLERLIEEHPGHYDTSYSGPPTPEEQQAYRALVEERDKLRRELVFGTKP